MVRGKCGKKEKKIITQKKTLKIIEWFLLARTVIKFYNLARNFAVVTSVTTLSVACTCSKGCVVSACLYKEHSLRLFDLLRNKPMLIGPFSIFLIVRILGF